MRLSYIAIIAIIAGTGLATGGSAKTLAEATTPANFPPSDFEGRTYVDNDGCVYIRAGVDGNTTWVPRVTRSRQVICGQTPTFGTTRVASASQATPAPAAAPTTAQPETRTATVAPATTTAPAAAPAAAETTTRRVVQATTTTRQTTTRPAAASTTVASAAPRATPAPRVVRRVVQAPSLATPVVTVSPPQPTTPKAQRTVVRTAGGCADAPASSRPFFNSTGVRCGPQAQDPSSGIRILRPGEAVAGFPSGRVSAEGLFVPEGYRSVWTDGRLNPRRGLPTTTASASVGTKGYDLAWTRKAPHLLYDRRTGLVVGDEFPGLVYPNLDLSTVVASAPAATATVRATTSSVAPRVTPSQAQEVAKVIAPTLRHVQVATFGSMDQAKPAAQRLANTGVPTRIGNYSRDGQKRQVIVLGPFANTAELNRALNIARAQGFTRAFARK